MVFWQLLHHWSVPVWFCLCLLFCQGQQVFFLPFWLWSCRKGVTPIVLETNCSDSHHCRTQSMTVRKSWELRFLLEMGTNAWEWDGGKFLIFFARSLGHWPCITLADWQILFQSPIRLQMASTRCHNASSQKLKMWLPVAYTKHPNCPSCHSLPTVCALFGEEEHKLSFWLGTMYTGETCFDVGFMSAHNWRQYKPISARGGPDQANLWVP